MKKELEKILGDTICMKCTESGCVCQEFNQATTAIHELFLRVVGKNRYDNDSHGKEERGLDIGYNKAKAEIRKLIKGE
ncbi:MAG: hypothetical protein ABGF52_13530 [Candidatus Asgardarchaeum sp.]